MQCNLQLNLHHGMAIQAKLVTVTLLTATPAYSDTCSDSQTFINRLKVATLTNMRLERLFLPCDLDKMTLLTSCLRVK